MRTAFVTVTVLDQIGSVCGIIDDGEEVDMGGEELHRARHLGKGVG